MWTRSPAAANRRISRTWIRRLTAFLTILVAGVAAVPWLIYFLGIGLNAASATYTRITAESGESVVVQQSGFDRRDYAVYGQEASFLYQRSAEGKSVSDVFDLSECTLAAAEGTAAGASGWRGFLILRVSSAKAPMV